MKARVIDGGITLSVGMIVKNEEKFLEKCLEALKPLLSAVKSELIIVDTGSSDKTVEIAERYADKVLNFEWVNDFSAARNFGLKKCVGEWFMFLDADDHFDGDFSEMTEFFNDKAKSAKYNSAYYVTRNYSKPGDDAHSDLFVQRIARRTPELCFTGKIHETLDNLFLPSYYFKTFAHHYGYVFESKEQKEAKRARNLGLLLKALEEEPDSIRVLCQIADCTDDKKEAENYFLKAIELLKKADYPYAYVKPYLCAVNYYSDRDSEKAAFYADEYIKTAKSDETHLIDAYAYKAVALYRRQRYGECVEAILKYREYYGKFRNDELDKSTMIFCIVNYLDEKKYNFLTGLVAVCRAKEERFDEAYRRLEEAYGINDAEYVKDVSSDVFQEAVFAVSDVAKGRADFNKLAEYYSAVVAAGDNDKLNFFNAALEKLYYESEDPERFASEASAASNEGFFGLMGLISLTDGEKLQEFLDGFTPISSGKPHGYSEMFYLAIKYGANLSSLIQKLKREQMEESLVAISRNHSDYARLVLDYCVKERFTGSVKELFFAVSALERAALSPNGLSAPEKAFLFENFTDMAAIYVANVYNPDLLNDSDIGALSELHRFGYYMAVGRNALEKGDKLGYARALKEALRNYEEMKDVISFLLDDFLTEM
ncbi:MAG: glycosyltransferase family 2 protein [Oscillospiraceae bacterium]|jgi:glycosyltransferase involved in cell wall biosynthesis|nr:glycosyltransferase family 2 protein [Oscillospiraceae bacterium]